MGLQYSIYIAPLCLQSPEVTSNFQKNFSFTMGCEPGKAVLHNIWSYFPPKKFLSSTSSYLGLGLNPEGQIHKTSYENKISHQNCSFPWSFIWVSGESELFLNPMSIWNQNAASWWCRICSLHIAGSTEIKISPLVLNLRCGRKICEMKPEFSSSGFNIEIVFAPSYKECEVLGFCVQCSASTD